MVVRNNDFGIKFVADAQSVALRACPIGAVETERSWLEFTIADLAFRTGIAGTVNGVAPDRLVRRAFFLCCLRTVLAWWFFFLERAENHCLITMLQRRLNRLSNPRCEAGSDHDPIDDGFNVMVFPGREFRKMFHVDDFSVNAGPDES